MIDRRRLSGLDTKLCMAEYGNNILRPYRLFVPDAYQYAPAEPGETVPAFPLVVMLHGGGAPAHPCDENWYFANKETTDRVQTVAEERGYLVACPALPFTRVPPKAADRLERITEELVEHALPLIDAVIKELTYDYHIDEKRIYLSGASRGGLAAYASASANPDRYAAIAAVSTTCPPEWVDQAARVPTLILHAVEDGIFPIEKARELKERLAGAGCDAGMREFPGGHDGLRTLAAYTVIFDWFDAHARPGGTSTP